jgi:hypothetical protein
MAVAPSAEKIPQFGKDMGHTPQTQIQPCSITDRPLFIQQGCKKWGVVEPCNNTPTAISADAFQQFPAPIRS